MGKAGVIPERKLEIKGWKRILLMVFPYFIFMGIFQSVGALMGGIDLSRPDDPWSLYQQLLVSFFGLLGTFLLLWVFMRFIDKEKFIELGFHLENRSAEIIVGVGLGALVMGGGFLILLGGEEIGIQGFGFDFQKLLGIGMLFLIVGFVEEALFRGYILRNLLESFSAPIALIGSSVLFALAHAANPNLDAFSLFVLFLAGLLFGASYVYTRNLWFPIALHFSWNLFQSLFGFNVSGQDFYSLIELDFASANLLNGGAFGFEGSILSVIAILCIVALIVYYYQVKTPVKSHNRE